MGYDGVLTPVEYVIDPAPPPPASTTIYDYRSEGEELRAQQGQRALPRPSIPREVSAEDVREDGASTILQGARTAGIVGRIDFRLSDDGRMPYFLEINALPSAWSRARGIYASAELRRPAPSTATIGNIIQSAAKRYKIKDSARRQGQAARARAARLRVGFTYNVKRVDSPRWMPRRTVRPSMTRPRPRSRPSARPLPRGATR